jgi:hypothetical protein
MTPEEVDVVRQWVEDAWDAGYGAAMGWSIKAIGGNIGTSPANPYRIVEIDEPR